MKIHEWRLSIHNDLDLSSYAKLIAYTLANYYRPGRETFPSIASLMEFSDLSVNTVRNAIKELEENEYIKVTKKTRKNKSQKQNHFEFILSSGDTVNDTMNDTSNDRVNDISNDISSGDTEYRRIKKNLVKEKDTKVSKKKFGNYQKVKLTDQEHHRLIEDYGQRTVEEYIQRLDEYNAMKGDKYKDHNAVIRNWLNRDGIEKINAKSKPRTPGKIIIY